MCYSIAIYLVVSSLEKYLSSTRWEKRIEILLKHKDIETPLVCVIQYH